MTTRADLEGMLARDLRDTGNVTWTTAELDDLLNEGIDFLGDIYPREIVSNIGTVSANVYTYAASSFLAIYRLDVYTADGSYDGTLPSGIGAGPNSGWELHGGVVYLPPNFTLTAGEVLKAFGYGRYTQLAASSSVTDLSSTGEWAVRAYAVAQAYSRLLIDRALFQQWQSNSNATDVGPIQLAQLAEAANREWERHKSRLRRMRKTG